MSHEDIRAALAAATPGPWAVTLWNLSGWMPKLWAEDQLPIEERGPFAAGSVMGTSREQRDADAHLIANAPTWLAELLAEVDRLARWQTEMTEVLRGLQDLGKALGLPLGERITGQSACVTAVALHDRTEAAEQAVQRVRELHAPMQHGPKGQRTICVHCFARYPCTTMRALDGGEQHG